MLVNIGKTLHIQPAASIHVFPLKMRCICTLWKQTPFPRPGSDAIKNRKEERGNNNEKNTEQVSVPNTTTSPPTCTIMNILISITTGNSHRSWPWMRCFGTLFTYVYPLPCYTSVCSETGEIDTPSEQGRNGQGSRQSELLRKPNLLLKIFDHTCTTNL